jgi:hypothetical protein
LFVLGAEGYAGEVKKTPVKGNDNPDKNRAGGEAIISFSGERGRQRKGVLWRWECWSLKIIEELVMLMFLCLGRRFLHW